MRPPKNLTEPGNENRVRTDAFSNRASYEMYVQHWPDDPKTRNLADNGFQCLTCSFYAPFNMDWGLCCHRKSRHFTETVWEHFTCPVHVSEGSGAHSFTEDRESHCRCQDMPTFYPKTLEDVQPLESVQRHYAGRVLAICRNNLQNAARRLEISVKTLRQILKI
jgi:hypothetical protein